MRILVVSDTHGDLQHLESVLSEEDDFDMLLHCGDICGDEDRVRQLVMCAFLGVAGNMDFSGRFPRDRLGVTFDTETLVSEAVSEGADIALYGHTHVPEIHTQQGIWVMNPGSLSYPRQRDRRPSYGVIEIGDDGSITCEIRYL